MLTTYPAPRRPRGRARPPRARAHRGPREDDQEGQAQARRQRDVPQPVPRRGHHHPRDGDVEGRPGRPGQRALRRRQEDELPQAREGAGGGGQEGQARPDRPPGGRALLQGPARRPGQEGRQDAGLRLAEDPAEAAQGARPEVQGRLAADRDQRGDRAQGGLRPAPDARQRGPRARRQEAPREGRQGRARQLLQEEPARRAAAGPDAHAQPRLRGRLLQHPGQEVPLPRPARRGLRRRDRQGPVRRARQGRRPRRGRCR